MILYIGYICIAASFCVFGMGLVTRNQPLAWLGLALMVIAIWGMEVQTMK